ncbi:MAG: cytochrome C peroxidase [Methylohalobius sp.]|nr:cytochrome C peroxidase [Methylohalobius sp.]
MKSIWFVWLTVLAMPALAHGPRPVSLQNVPIPEVPGLLDGSDPIIVDKNKAIALGKALFWDINVGSDGIACASCHFHAGADIRVKNQLTPGKDGGFSTLPSGGGGPNYALQLNDFPLFRFNDPLDKESGVIFETDDVVSSSGTFSGEFVSTSRFSGSTDNCARAADPVFHVGSLNTRRVEPRHAPSVINAIFNYRNFWDGRANHIFNGVNPWGERDEDAGVWVKVNTRQVVKQALHLENSSLASLATAPPLSDTEMACRGRNWPDIGRKLLARQPLQYQKVHPQDSVLGSLSLSTPGELRPGLNTTYRRLVMQAFNPKYWSYSGVGPFGAPTSGSPYTQMEANFPMFFGLAIQMYLSTLVSDQAPIDLSPLDPYGNPTWEGLGFTQVEREKLTRGFEGVIAVHCNLCHGGPLLTTAAIETNSVLVTPTPGKTFGPEYALIPYGPNAFGPIGAQVAGIGQHANVVTRDDTLGGPKLMDMGFANTGVAHPDDDPGVGGVDEYGNPLSFAAQYVQYLLGNLSRVKDPQVRHVYACDFVRPIAFPASGLFPTLFTHADGIEADGAREGSLRNQNCLNPSYGYIPTVAAANAAGVNSPKLAVAVQGAFKIPTLRNVELTGPYMHNGSMATLEQVIEFYARRNNVDSPHKHVNAGLADALAGDPQLRDDIVFFLKKALTDERVRYERAPFDHPELPLPAGHVGDHYSVTPSSLAPNLAQDEMEVIPAVGASGRTTPLKTFEEILFSGE